MSLPYMPFWVGDYLKDTMHLNTQQHGAYMLLLFHMWSTNAPSNSTSNETSIAKALLKHCPSICKMNKSEWDEIKDDILEFFIIDGDYVVSKRLTEQLNTSNLKNIKAKERGAKGAESRWGKKTDAQSNRASIEQAINKQCLTDSNQSQSQTFNHSSNDINEEDALFLARAQEIDHYKNYDFVGESEEQKKDMDEAYEATCQKEDGSKFQLGVVSANEIPIFEEAKAWATRYFEKLDFENWFKHWESINWIDSNKSRIEWKRKMAYNAKERMFIKTTTTAAQKQQFKQIGYDVDQARETTFNFYQTLKAQQEATA